MARPSRGDRAGVGALAVLLAAIVCTPLALAVVVAHWQGMAPATHLWGRAETAPQLVRTFVVTFDVLVLATWAPAALLVSRRRV